MGYTGPKPELDSSWIGEAFSEDAALEMAQRTGFELRYQYGAGTQYYWLWLFKK
jgi:hypothetical protein